MSVAALHRRRRPGAPMRATRGESVLSMRTVTARRGERVVLCDADLDVMAGEIVAVVGPNGAGKSSLIGAVTGELGRTGTITIGKRSIADWTAAELALHRAVLPQTVAVAFPFLARDVVRMGRSPWRAVRHAGAVTDDEAVIEGSLRAVDALELSDRPVTALSGGERARVALARVLAQRAQLLLLDEPTAALDLGHQEMVMRVLRERADAGDAVVVVLHDLSLAAAHATRMVVIDGGRIVAVGSPTEVCDRELLGGVYRTPVDVVPHPSTGDPIVVPDRRPGSS